MDRYQLIAEGYAAQDRPADTLPLVFVIGSEVVLSSCNGSTVSTQKKNQSMFCF